MKRYVVTNRRFTEEFRQEVAASLFAATPLLFDCEEMTFDDDAPRVALSVTIDQIGNLDGAFVAHGHTDDLVIRLEEEMGTLYVSTP